MVLADRGRSPARGRPFCVSGVPIRRSARGSTLFPVLGLVGVVGVILAQVQGWTIRDWAPLVGVALGLVGLYRELLVAKATQEERSKNLAATVEQQFGQIRDDIAQVREDADRALRDFEERYTRQRLEDQARR